MAIVKGFTITGKMINKDTETGKWWMSLMENDKFRSVIEGLYEFVGDTNADCDMAYDWVCDQCEIDTFVADNWAWDCFFEVYFSAKF